MVQKYENSTQNNLYCLFPIQNLWKSNPNTTVNLTPILIGSFSTLLILCEHVSVCKHYT
jgi:hypothetical protein